MKKTWHKSAFKCTCKPNKVRVNHFNLLEIVLALAVVAIGVISIMGLFPIGVGANRRAQDNVYVTMAADTVANYLVAQRRLMTDEIRYNTYKNPYPSFAAHKKAKTDLLFDLFYKMDTNDATDAGSKADISYLPEPPDTIVASNWTKVSDNDAGAVIYQLKGSGDSKATYRVVFKTKIGSNPDLYPVDFDCIVMVGLGEYEARSMVSRTTNSQNKWRLPGPRLAVNVYWPSQVPALRRENRTFSRRLRVNGTHVYDWRPSKGQDL